MMNMKVGDSTVVPHVGDSGYASHFFFVLCLAALGAFAAWAYFGQLDVVSDAIGEVVPSSQVKSIQHLEGGIVHEILVREGERVKPGQALIVLERTASDADVQEMTVRLTALRIDIARLKAELGGVKKITFPADISRDHGQLVRAAVSRFETRRSRVQNQIKALRQLLTQRREEVREIRARMDKRQKSRGLLKEQIKISEDLMKEDLTNRMLHLNLLKEETSLTGGIAEDEAAIKRTQAAVTEARAQISVAQDSFIEEVRQDLDDKLRSHREFSERMGKLKDNLARTVLRSPVDGFVKTLHVATVGGVVRSGETLLDIVPADDRLVIEAKLPAQDVGYVAIGQLAKVKLASADAIRFGRLDGRVVRISPDTIVTEDNLPYYKVRVEVDAEYFERRGARYLLVPGVVVICSIQTGRRSVMEYLLDPFLGAFQAAMQER